MNKYLLTGRTVRLTEDQRNAASKNYLSLRAMAYDNKIALSKLISSFCGPDNNGGYASSCLILSSIEDLRKDPKTGLNEAMQLIHAADKALTIYHYMDNQLILLKKHGMATSIPQLFNKLSPIIDTFKLALVQQKWLQHEYDEYYPCTEYGTSYSVNLQNALKQAMTLMRRNLLNTLEIVADRYNNTLTTLFYIAQITGTDLKFTWIAIDGTVETHTWTTRMDFNSFLELYTDLNVYRYETNDEHGLRVTKYSKPRPLFIDENPVEHTNDDPEDFEERMAEQGIDASTLISYDQLQAQAYEADDNYTMSDAGVKKIRKALNVNGLIKVDYKQEEFIKMTHITPRYNNQAHVLPICASEPKPNFAQTVDTETGKVIIPETGSGCDLCKSNGSAFCKTCPYRKEVQ